MDFLKSQLDRIQLQLKGLSATQKMLTAALVAIMVMTLMMWGRYAGTAEMEPLLNQSLAEDDIAKINAELDAHHIDHRMDGNRILVPADRKMESLSYAGFAGALPRNFSSGFDEMMKQISPFASQSTQDEMFKKVKEGALAQIISNFPSVKQAVVVIGSNSRRQIGHGGDVEASATISIFMQGSATATAQLVNAAADVVCGAEANLNRTRVKINVDGVPRKVTGGDDNGLGGGDPTDRLAIINSAEKRIEEKIQSQFGYIQGMMVAVAVDLNSKTIKKQSTVYDEKNSIHTSVSESSHSIESTNPAPAAGEPGANPNVGSNVPLAINGGAGGGGDGATNTETDDKTEFTLKPAFTNTDVIEPAGDVTTVSASVRVPRSYFVNSLRGNNNGKDPEEKAVNVFISQELATIREDVRKIAKLKSTDDVSVATYLDAGPLLVGGPPVASNASVSLMVGSHTKEIVLGALAVISLFMVSMMVRKGGPSPVVVTPSIALAPQPPAILDGGEKIAGEAGDGDSALDGVELDDDAIKTQQMLEQVGTMVGDDPDAAAALVKRWLNRT